tara:strand:- start:23662 stop:23862 length:201 start_codon:yes stop_codon:yes gene_type:complete
MKREQKPKKEKEELADKLIDLICDLIFKLPPGEERMPLINLLLNSPEKGDDLDTDFLHPHFDCGDR